MGPVHEWGGESQIWLRSSPNQAHGARVSRVGQWQQQDCASLAGLSSRRLAQPGFLVDSDVVKESLAQETRNQIPRESQEKDDYSVPVCLPGELYDQGCLGLTHQSSQKSDKTG